MQNLHQSTWDNQILYADIFRRWTTFNETTFARIQKYERGGRLKVKINILLSNILFYGENHEPLHLVDWSFEHWKILDIPASLFESFSLTELLNMAEFRNYELM
jgi:hypothetical protein